MRTFACLLIGAITLCGSQAFTQTSESTSVASDRSRGSRAAAAASDFSLATPAGVVLSAGLGGYTYREPGGAHAISIHGPKFVGGFTGTAALSQRQHWFIQFDLRGVVGNTTYDGWCSPFVLKPNSASPNGYEVDIDTASASRCSESGDRDWYFEARGLAGKDFIGRGFALSAYGGIGLRYLSNGTTGTPGYRIDKYLYVPLGLIARTRAGSYRTLAFTLEYDRLLHGWQNTRGSLLGGGTVPATSTAPAFTINGFSDVAFSQSSGWAVRASASFQMTRRWSLELYYLYWRIQDSQVNTQTITLTVNNITARETLGFFEPFNTTREIGVKLGLRF